MGEPATGKHWAAAQALAAVTGIAAGLASVLGLVGAAAPVSFSTMRGDVVVLFGAGIYRFDSLFSGAGNRGTDRSGLAEVVGLLPRRAPAILLIVSGVVTAVIWVGPVLAAQFAGAAPARLDGYTTAVTVAIDCAVLAPAAIAAGLLIWRRRPWGYLMGIPLLILLALLAPVIAAQTISQLSAGVILTPGEIVGPVSGFVVLAVAAIMTLWSMLHRISRQRRSVLCPGRGAGRSR